MRHRTRVAAISIAALALAPVTGGAQASFRTDTVVVDRGARDPAVSPDGTRIAVSILGKIWLVPIAGGTGTQLTTGEGWDTHPAWSPDGRFIAYSHNTPTGADLVVHTLATGSNRYLFHAPGQLLQLLNAELGQITYHPVTGDIYFVVSNNQYDAHVWRVSPVVELERSKAEQVTYGNRWHEWSFAFSPDGRTMLFDEGQQGGSDLYQMDLHANQITRLTNSSSIAHHLSAVWSADGTQFYVERNNGVDRVVARTPATGATRTVYTAPFDDKQIALMPDGRSAVLCTGRRLVRLDLATGATKPIPFRAPTVVRRPASRDLIITNARLIDGTGAAPIPNATVEVRNGRIVAIRKGAEAVRSASSIPVIDAHGMTLLPGLIDNHYHYWFPYDARRKLLRGVTTVRDPGTPLTPALNFKDAVNLGILQGPRSFTTGPLVDGANGYHPCCDVTLDRVDAAAPLVRAMKAAGVDAIKVYFMLDPDVLAAVVKEAHAQGLPVTGHIGVRTGWGQATDAGIDGVNHVRVWHDFLPAADQPNGDNGTLSGSGAAIARMQADWHKIDPDSPEVGALLKKMAEHHVALDPTLGIQAVGPVNRGDLSPEQFAWRRESPMKMGRFVARAVQSGVTLLAGTDVEETLFNEMESYAAAGIPPMTIIQSATRNGAEWLGQGKDFGTVEVGKRGDLLLVQGDPLQDISALRNTNLVVQDGVVIFQK